MYQEVESGNPSVDSEKIRRVHDLLKPTALRIISRVEGWKDGAIATLPDGLTALFFEFVGGFSLVMTADEYEAMSAEQIAGMAQEVLKKVTAVKVEDL